MNIPQAIKLLLDRINSAATNQPLSGTFSAFGGTVGNTNMLQRDLNAAITAWRETHDTTGLKQVVATLQAYGNLTDTEYQQIMEVLQAA